MSLLHKFPFATIWHIKGSEKCFDGKWYGALGGLILVVLSAALPFKRLYHFDVLSRFEQELEPFTQVFDILFLLPFSYLFLKPWSALSNGKMVFWVCYSDSSFMFCDGCIVSTLCSSYCIQHIAYSDSFSRDSGHYSGTVTTSCSSFYCFVF